MGFEDVSGEKGRRGQPRMQATCDECGRAEVFACPKGDEGHAKRRITAMKWSLVRGKLHCPICDAKRKVSTVKATSGNVPEPTSPREPTRAERREIIDMLNDVYDVKQERYCRGDTDDTLADVLGVMPGWVAQLREEFFGSDGSNEDIAALLEELESFKCKVEVALKKAAKMQAELEVLRKSLVTVADLTSRLKQIEKAVGPRKMALVK